MKRGKSRLKLVKPGKPLRVGFLPVNDCAPVVVAQELGIYQEYGLNVELHRETSWKTLHDKIVARQLDAAQVPCALPFLARLGLTSEPCDFVAGMVLSLQGNAITVSAELSRHGVCDALTFGDVVRRDAGKRTYTFGVVLPFSSQYFLLGQWLKSANINPYVDVRILMAAPSQMFPLLKLGYLDGYCVGEPWTSVAIQAGIGHCVSTSSLLSPLHPETVLMVREDFACKRADEHERLVAALLESSDFCDQPKNRAPICNVLAGPRYVDAPAECLQPGLIGPFGTEASKVFSLHGLNLFHRYRANQPTAARAAWIIRQLHDYFRWRVHPTGLHDVFRRDIFQRAQKLVTNSVALNPPDKEASSQVLCANA